MNYRYFKKEASGKYCRDCINRMYGVQLDREECRYWLYHAVCKRCGELRHIVMGVRPVSRWKIWLQVKRNR